MRPTVARSMVRITFQRDSEWFVQGLDGSGLRKRKYGDKGTRSLSPLGTYAVWDMRLGSPWNIDSVFRLADREEVLDLADWADDVHAYGWLSDRELVVPVQHKTLIFDVETGDAREIPIGGAYLEVSANGVIALEHDGHTHVVDTEDGSRVDVGPGIPRAISPSGNQVCVRRDRQHFLLRRPFQHAELIEPVDARLIVAGFTHSSLLFGTLIDERSHIVLRDPTGGWRRISQGGTDARARLHPELDLILYDHAEREVWVIDDDVPRRVASDARYARWVHRFEEPL